MYARHAQKDLEIVGVAFAGRGAYLDQKLRELEMPWPQVAESRGPRGEIPQLYKVSGVSTFVLVSRDGKILGRGSQLAKMKSLIETLLESEKTLQRGR
jgi:hypothetical protein